MGPTHHQLDFRSGVVTTQCHDICIYYYGGLFSHETGEARLKIIKTLSEPDHDEIEDSDVAPLLTTYRSYH